MFRPSKDKTDAIEITGDDSKDKLGIFLHFFMEDS